VGHGTVFVATRWQYYGVHEAHDWCEWCTKLMTGMSDRLMTCTQTPLLLVLVSIIVDYISSYGPIVTFSTQIYHVYSVVVGSYRPKTKLV